MTTFNINFPELNPAGNVFVSGFHINDFFVLNGSGFGTKNNVYTYYQDFEKVAINANVTQGNNAGGTGLVLRNGGNCSIATDLPHSGTRCWKKKYTQNQDTPRLGLRFPTPARKVIYSCYWRYHATSMLTACDWKLARIGNNTDDAYTYSRFDHEYTGLMKPSTTSMNTATRIGVTDTVREYWGTIDGGGAAFYPQPDTWYFYQMIADAGDYLTNNHYFEIKLNGVSQGYFNGSHISDPTFAIRNVANPDMFRGLLTVITGLVNSDGNDVDMWMDEMYTTCSWNYAILTNSAIFSTSTQFAQLNDRYWTDNKILFDKTNFGSFTSGTNAYLHIFVNNVWQSSTPITVP